MSKRPRRRVKIKSSTPIQLPRKWKNEEMETLLRCIMEYGHKNLDKISEHLPGRSLENIKTFIRTVHDTAGKLEKQNDVLDVWINQCTTTEGTPWRDSIQIAQVVKYLSVDGLLENHPLPERCQGIDFSQAYRLVYQAMMGYPIQPVNKPTADFVTETLAELSGEIRKQMDAIKNVESFLNGERKEEPSCVVNEPEATNSQANTLSVMKKPLKVYQRKKPVLSNPSVTPSLKIVVEEVHGSGDSRSGSSKDFCVAVEGSHTNSTTTVNVPVPYEKEIDVDETELLKSPSYNPFRIPEKWLKEPLYINLLQTL